jgi:hypothetical protein
MGAARLALEPVRDALGTIAVAAAAPAKVRDRNQDERLAVLVETAYSLLCGAMHDDELTKTFRYTRYPRGRDNHDRGGGGPATACR